MKTFVAIAGGNLRLSACHGLSAVPTCSEVDGFNPGVISTSGPSKFLSELNNQGGTEAIVYMQYGLERRGDYS